MNLKKNLIVVFIVLSTAAASQAFARDYKVSAGISTGLEFYDRSNSNDNKVSKDDSYNRIRITPLIKISSLTARDELAFKYAPGFRYDYDSYEHDIDHNLLASYNRFITSTWQLSLSESYRLSDMVEDGAAPASSDSSGPISDTDGRRQYWTNTLSFDSNYTYWQNSQFSLGYVYTILENVNSDRLSNYENYDRHAATMAVSHQFNPRWNGTVNGRYVRGLYESTGSIEGAIVPPSDNDLSEYMLSTTIGAAFFEHHPLSLTYAFSATDYDDSLRDDSTIHDITFGWQWDISEALVTSLGGGPSYVDISGQDGEWKYNGNFSLNYEMEKSSVQFSSAGGYEYQNFSGTDESGLRKYWQSRVDYSYQILKDLSFSLYSSYRDEDRQEPSVLARIIDSNATADSGNFSKETINRKILTAGTGIGYTFAHFYSVTLSYNFVKRDSDAIRDNYDEHRLNLMLSYNRDLFSW